MEKKETKYILAFLLAFCANPSMAQKRGIGIDISANLTGSIKILTMHSINIEEAERINDVIRINPRYSRNAGKIVAVGIPSSNFRINFPKRQELNKQNGSTSLTFTYSVALNDKDDQSSAELLNEQSRKFQLNEHGRYYFWIGGEVNIANAPPGNYIGEFTIEINYR